MSPETLPLCPPPKYRLGTPVTNCFRAEATFAAAPPRVLESLRAALPAGPIVGWPARVALDGPHLRARYRVYLFLDTLEAVVLPEGTGSRVVVRSTSHIGRNDFGINRRRVERLLSTLEACL